MLTLEQFQSALPVKDKSKATKETLDVVNKILHEPEWADVYKENMITYSQIMQGGRFTVKQYVNAIKFTTFVLSGHTQKDSFIKTFPDKYKGYIDRNTSEDDIDTYVSAYNRTKLVTAIREQAYIPVWLLNQHHYQDAINTQASLMKSAKSEKVRSDAANSLLNHLKAPEKNNIELDITVNQKDFIKDLRNTMGDLVNAQKHAIESGNANAKDIAESNIIEGELSE